MIIGAGGKRKIVTICRFDENGYAEVDETKLSQTTLTKLKPYYTDEKVTEKAKEVKETKVYKCKKCDYETESKSLLMRHYRNEHPKK